MEIQIPKKWFDANAAKFAKAFSEKYSDDPSESTYLLEVSESDQNFEEQKDGSVDIYCSSEEGVWVKISWKDNADLIVELVTWAVKRLNKFKTMIEAII